MVDVRTQAPPADRAAEDVFGGARMECGDSPDAVEKYSPGQDRDERGRFAGGAADVDNVLGGRGIMHAVDEPDRVEPTPDEARGTDGKVCLKDCYRQAGRYVTGHPGATLVHGTITPAHGIPIGHAWAELRRPDGAELVYDGVQGKFYSRASYYRNMRAVPERTYDQAEAMKSMLRTKHFGPWHRGAGL